jgi:predicted nucleic acid-binding Zn ribbon protein
MKKQCIVCGEPFDPFKNRKTCSRTCSEIRNPKPWPRKCSRCGEVFESQTKRPLCIPCAKAKRQRAPSLCLICGTPTGRSNRKTCSPECKAAYARGPISPTECPTCGSTFTPKYRYIRFCSAECNAADKNRQKRRRNFERPHIHTEQQRRYAEVNKERIAEKDRRWREANRERRIAAKRQGRIRRSQAEAMLTLSQLKGDVSL